MSADDPSRHRGAPRTLVISARGFKRPLSNCPLYEFEDLIAAVDGATLHAPPSESDGRRRLWRTAKLLSRSDALASRVAPMPRSFVEAGDFDLLLAVLDNPWQTHLIDTVPRWRERSRVTACVINELWPSDLERARLRREPFARFDHVFLNGAAAVEPLARLTGRAVHYLPIATDVERFAPDPDAPFASRPIDVACIGRRPPDVHGALREDARARRIWYHHDTVVNHRLQTIDPAEHRDLHATVLRGTKLSLAYPAKSGRVALVAGAQELGARYWEAAAAGAVLAGEAPPNLAEVFGPGVEVVPLPRGEGAADTRRRVRDALADTERLDALSRAGVASSLGGHDWMHRWRWMLETMGLPVSGAVRARLDALGARARAWGAAA